MPHNSIRKLFSKGWVVYCKRPFFGPRQVVEYLRRYTHKIAISNHRIKNIEDAMVTSSVKDYRHAGKKGLLVLPQVEFIRRFALHILPKGFVRIRHYGILSSTAKRSCLPALQQHPGLALPVAEKPPLLIHKCPYCKKGDLVTVAVFAPRRPPTYIQRVKNKNNPHFFLNHFRWNRIPILTSKEMNDL